MKSILQCVFLLPALSLFGCGGGGGGDSAPISSASVGGLWSGPATAIDNSSTYELFGAITESGRFIFISEFGLDIGSIVTTGTSINGVFDSYSFSGDEVSGLLTGSIAERDRLSGTILTTDNVEAGTIDLEYDNAYEVPTSLSDIAGTYSMSLEGFTETYTFDDDGTFTGSDTNGCTYSGNLAIIDARYSVLDITGQVSGCVDTASFSGLAAFENATGDTNNILVAGGGGDNGAFIAILEKN